MKVLAVIAHPLAESLCGELARTVIAELKQQGHDVRVRDLNASGFSPALTKRERQTYYSGFDASAVAAETGELQWAEAIVLVFPTWWFGFPAILKGWFDRVWAPGIAYDHAADLGTITPRLAGLRRVLAITTLGAPWWVDWLVMRRPVRRILKTAILQFCAPHCRLDFISFYASEKYGAPEVEAAKAKVQVAANRMAG